MSYVDTLLFDGTDLQALDGLVIEDLSGLFALAIRRGDHDTIPGRQGKYGNELPYDAYPFAVPITVYGTSRHELLTRLRALGNALRGTGGLGQLARHQDNGVGGYDAHTAAGQFASFNTFTTVEWLTVKTELNFINLDGAWYDGAAWLVP